VYEGKTEEGAAEGEAKEDVENKKAGPLISEVGE